MMNLVKQRNEWRKQLEENGKIDNSILDNYKKYRNTEDWRATVIVEQLCEYIIFLEERIELVSSK